MTDIVDTRTKVDIESVDIMLAMARNMDTLDSRVRQLERDNAAMKGDLEKICKVWFPQMANTIKELKRRVFPPAPAVPSLFTKFGPAPIVPPLPAFVPKRIDTTYDSWCKIQHMRRELGMSDKEISRSLKIPYSTVRKYIGWDKETVEKKRHEQYKANSPGELLRIERMVFSD